MREVGLRPTGVEMSEKDIYLGDGLYAIFDGYQIWLMTERGGKIHEVALEFSVFLALLDFAKSLGWERE